MKKNNYLILSFMLFLSILIFFSCKKKDTNNNINQKDFTAKSKVEKGPFVKGTSIMFFEVDKNLSQTGKQFLATVLDDLGSFEMTGQINSDNYLLGQADGYFYNESTGKLSTSRIVLTGLCNPNSSSSMNINLLTHLERNRVETLIKNGKTFEEAKSQSITEILTFFNISKTVSSSEQLQVFGSGGELFSISSIFLNNKTDAQYTDLMTAFSQDLSDNGIIDNNSTI